MFPVLRFDDMGRVGEIKNPSFFVRKFSGGGEPLGGGGGGGGEEEKKGVAFLLSKITLHLKMVKNS